jgi:hypothetical protein
MSAKSLKRCGPARVVVNNSYRVRRFVDPAAVTVADKDGEAGILGESRIAEREIAKDKNRAACGFEAAGVEAIGTEAGRNPPIRSTFFLTHKSSISQEATLADTAESRIVA